MKSKKNRFISALAFAPLVVKLEERDPVARIQASDESGATKQLLVARDGVVYDGVNYTPGFLAELPWLDGVRLVRAGHGISWTTGL